MKLARYKHHMQNNSQIFPFRLSSKMLSGYPASRTGIQCCSWPRAGTLSTTTTGTRGPGPSRMASGLQRWEASWVSCKESFSSVITWSIYVHISILGLSAMAEALLRDPNQLSLVRESGQVCRDSLKMETWKGIKKIFHRSSLPGRTIRMTWQLFNTWKDWVWTESYMTGDLTYIQLMYISSDEN